MASQSFIVDVAYQPATAGGLATALAGTTLGSIGAEVLPWSNVMLLIGLALIVVGVFRGTQDRRAAESADRAGFVPHALIAAALALPAVGAVAIPGAEASIAAFCVLPLVFWGAVAGIHRVGRGNEVLSYGLALFSAGVVFFTAPEPIAGAAQLVTGAVAALVAVAILYGVLRLVSERFAAPPPA